MDRRFCFDLRRYVSPGYNTHIRPLDRSEKKPVTGAAYTATTFTGRGIYFTTRSLYVICVYARTHAHIYGQVPCMHVDNAVVVVVKRKFLRNVNNIIYIHKKKNRLNFAATKPTWRVHTHAYMLSAKHTTHARRYITYLHVSRARSVYKRVRDPVNYYRRNRTVETFCSTPDN